MKLFALLSFSVILSTHMLFATENKVTCSLDGDLVSLEIQMHNISVPSTYALCGDEKSWSDSRILSFANTEIPPDKIIEIQKKLMYLNFYAGDIDGIYGVQTLNAVKSFQNFINRPEVGLLSDKSVRLLTSCVTNNDQTLAVPLRVTEFQRCGALSALMLNDNIAQQEETEHKSDATFLHEPLKFEGHIATYKQAVVLKSLLEHSQSKDDNQRVVKIILAALMAHLEYNNPNLSISGSERIKNFYHLAKEDLALILPVIINNNLRGSLKIQAATNSSQSELGLNLTFHSFEQGGIYEKAATIPYDEYEMLSNALNKVALWGNITKEKEIRADYNKLVLDGERKIRFMIDYHNDTFMSVEIENEQYLIAAQYADIIRSYMSLLRGLYYRDDMYSENSIEKLLLE